MTLVGSLAGAVLVLWAAVSFIFACLRPWAYLDRDDRWIAWVLILAGLWVLLAMIVELGLEYAEAKVSDRRHRRERAARGR